MKVIISPLAEKQLKKTPKFIQILIAGKVRQIGIGVVANSKQLMGYKSVYRIRIGDYRMVYKRYPDKYFIILIGHRKNIYLLLKNLFA